MSTKTTNYELVKPGYEDYADVEVINDNMDKIDTELYKVDERSDIKSETITLFESLGWSSGEES